MREVAQPCGLVAYGCAVERPPIARAIRSTVAPRAGASWRRTGNGCAARATATFGRAAGATERYQKAV